MKTVMVAGRVIFDNGVFLHVDRQAILEELDRALCREPGADDVARARLAVALLPHVRRFYAGWPQH